MYTLPAASWLHVLPDGDLLVAAAHSWDGTNRTQLLRVRPDGEKISADLKAWINDGELPAWRSRLTTSREQFTTDEERNIDYDNQYTIKAVELPKTITSTKSFFVGWKAHYLGGLADDYGDLDVYLHFISPEGEQVAGSGFVLWQAIAAGSLDLPIEARGVPLKAGTYAVYAGIWNRRSRSAKEISNAPSSDIEKGDKKFLVGTVEIVAD